MSDENNPSVVTHNSYMSDEASKGTYPIERSTEYQAPDGKEPVQPIYLAWLRNNKDPSKPWPQVWYGIDYSEAPEHKAMMVERFIEKHKVKWEHRFLGIENLAQLYPCGAGNAK